MIGWMFLFPSKIKICTLVSGNEEIFFYVKEKFNAIIRFVCFLRLSYIDKITT